MRKIYGVGINDVNGPIQSTVNGKVIRCPFYVKWTSILQRCYCIKELDRRPGYRKCLICDEWVYFSNFKAWMETQDWQGKHLDKDLLGDGKLYSPNKCCFVECWLNNLFTDRAAARGKYPLGVTRRKKRFEASIRVGDKGRYIGYFDTPEEASQAYKKAKLQHVKELMQGYPNPRIKEAVLKKAENLS